MHFSILFTAAGLVSAAAAQYNLVEDFMAGGFFSHFNFFTGGDPTGGFVNYLSYDAAISDQIINNNDGQAYIGVDWTTYGVGSPGRNSVRISSKNAYTYMLVTLNLYNMPGGVGGSWPAFWTFGPNWPNNGEIDIIEGANTQNVNYMTLHTGGSCIINGGGDGLIQNPYSNQCDANLNGNAGCSFHDTDTNSFGPGFNNNHGGVFAMEWTPSDIKIWRWLDDAYLPGDVFANNPNPANWGPPSVDWSASDSNCNFPGSFADHNIIFDQTFCGSWAGSVYPGGEGACESYVSNNAGAFKGSFWGITNMRVYRKPSYGPIIPANATVPVPHPTTTGGNTVGSTAPAPTVTLAPSLSYDTTESPPTEHPWTTLSVAKASG